MRIGYACLTLGVQNTNFRTCTLKNATDERLYELIGHNLNSLKNILLYNAENGIRLFRITSDLIPFGSSPANKLDWPKLFKDEFDALGHIIKENKIRVSMHPGQYTVINSPTPDVVSRAVDDLIYHTKILNALGTDSSSKIILHVGGVYGDKDSAISRFNNTYKNLDSEIKKRLIIENDDKSYTIGDVLKISQAMDIPVVYDNLHNEVNPYEDKPHSHWIDECSKTWRKSDGDQKIHYSQQDKTKSPGAHTQTTDHNKFLNFIRDISQDVDIMLEVKDKNLSAVKCINVVKPSDENLKKEWERYKLTVFEHSPEAYLAAKNIIEKKPNPSAFYDCIFEAQNIPTTTENAIKAADKVYLKLKSAMSEKEINRYLNLISKLNSKKTSIKSVKNFLFKVAVNSDYTNVKNSLYFHLND